MGNLTGCETVTFNAYGVADILKDNIKNNGEQIRNYGNVNDTTFFFNLDNQIGNTYIIGYGKEGYITKNPNFEYLGGTKLNKNHFIETMGNLEDAVEYRPNRIEGKVSMDIDFKDVDSDRIFTNEEIGKMSAAEFARLENFINQQLKAGNVMPEAQAKEQVKTGNLIYVNAYTRADGTHVSGYYRRKVNF